jgi:tRNA splicing ligase
MQIADIINSLRRNRHITEKKFGNISSFNFTRDAFYKGVWNAQTVKARGLYLDTMQNKVFCRGYEKFFKIGERPETEIPVLSKTLTYPITIYGKENGYLGLISYDYYNDDLFYTTKSDPSGPYAEHLRLMHQELTTEANRTSLKEYLKQNNCTLAVEVIDPEFDPHIIEYDTKKIVALELIENTMSFKHKTYAELLEISSKVGLSAKQWCTTCYNWDDFYNFIMQKANNPTWIQAAFERDTVEGYVMEDASGFMLKLKTDYYDLWKKRRGMAATIIKCGHYNYTGSLQTPEDNYFYAWLMENWREYHDNPQIPQDIITLRKKFKKYLDKTDKV